MLEFLLGYLIGASASSSTPASDSTQVVAAVLLIVGIVLAAIWLVRGFKRSL
ncbi:hypothetical protein [Cupriavidus sp. OTU4895]